MKRGRKNAQRLDSKCLVCPQTDRDATSPAPDGLSARRDGIRNVRAAPARIACARERLSWGVEPAVMRLEMFAWSGWRAAPALCGETMSARARAMFDEVLVWCPNRRTCVDR